MIYALVQGKQVTTYNKLLVIIPKSGDRLIIISLRICFLLGRKRN